MKSHHVNLFLVGFSHLEPLCSAAAAPQGMHRTAGLGKQAFYDDPPHYLEAVGRWKLAKHSALLMPTWDDKYLILLTT